MNKQALVELIHLILIFLNPFADIDHDYEFVSLGKSFISSEVLICAGVLQLSRKYIMFLEL